jgi:hypothetical protein
LLFNTKQFFSYIMSEKGYYWRDGDNGCFFLLNNALSSLFWLGTCTSKKVAVVSWFYGANDIDNKPKLFLMNIEFDLNLKYVRVSFYEKLTDNIPISKGCFLH